MITEEELIDIEKADHPLLNRLVAEIRTLKRIIQDQLGEEINALE